MGLQVPARRDTGQAGRARHRRSSKWMGWGQSRDEELDGSQKNSWVADVSLAEQEKVLAERGEGSQTRGGT